MFAAHHSTFLSRSVSRCSGGRKACQEILQTPHMLKLFPPPPSLLPPLSHEAKITHLLLCLSLRLSAFLIYFSSSFSFFLSSYKFSIVCFILCLFLYINLFVCVCISVCLFLSFCYLFANVAAYQISNLIVMNK